MIGLAPVVAAASFVSGCAVTVTDYDEGRDFRLSPDGKLSLVREWEPAPHWNPRPDRSTPLTVDTMHFVSNPEQKALVAANEMCGLPKGSTADKTQLKHAFNYFGQNYYEFNCPEPGKDS